MAATDQLHREDGRHRTDPVRRAAVHRHVLGHVPTGVVVVGAVDHDGPAGMLIGSFTSVSLDPQLVGFFPARTSTTWPRLRQAGRLCFNVLADDQGWIGDAFARTDGPKFDAVDWAPTAAGTPRLDGVAAWIDSTLYSETTAGDHWLVLAEVVDLGVDADKRPLVFCRGSYGGLASDR